MALGGSEGMLPRKVFKTLDTVMATLELFEQFFNGKFCLFFCL